MNKIEKVIVTGGAGFIGSNLVKKLVEKYEVHIIDNLSTGSKDKIHPKAKFHKADIKNLKSMAPIFKGAKFVFHLAALPRVQLSIDSPIETHEVNVTGTLNVLVASRDAKVKRVIYSASSSAYGDQKKYGLPQVGRVGPATLAKMKEVFGASSVSTSASMPSATVSTPTTQTTVADQITNQIKAIQDQIKALTAPTTPSTAVVTSPTPSVTSSSNDTANQIAEQIKAIQAQIDSLLKK